MYNDEFAKKFPCFSKVEDSTRAYCNLCCASISVSNGGLYLHNLHPHSFTLSHFFSQLDGLNNVLVRLGVNMKFLSISENSIKNGRFITIFTYFSAKEKIFSYFSD